MTISNPDFHNEKTLLVGNLTFHIESQQHGYQLSRSNLTSSSASISRPEVQGSDRHDRKLDINY